MFVLVNITTSADFHCFLVIARSLSIGLNVVWRYVFLDLRSNDFIIGLTDVSPLAKAPVLWQYDVCGQWPGVVGEGVTVHL